MRANKRSRGYDRNVSKDIGGRIISLWRQDTFLQNKGVLYSKMAGIQRGTIKLPVPLKSLGKTVYSFTVTLDRKLVFIGAL